MKKEFFWLLLLLCLSAGAAPDTTRIPAAWKNESVIILNYTFEYTINKERFNYYYANTDTYRDEEHLNISYYVRDKWGVNELSTFSLPSEIAESSNIDDRIGSIYKRNGTIVPLTKDHLSNYESSAELMRNGKIKKLEAGFTKSKKSKLAVPNLEPGDILEIELNLKTRDIPGLLLLQSEFPVLKYKYSISSSGIMSGGSSFAITGKIINADYTPISNGSSFKLEADSVPKAQNEILNDDLKQVPYVILDYSSSYDSYSGERTDQTDFTTSSSESREKLQRSLAMNIIQNINYGLVTRIKAALNKKYPKFTDTAAFVKDAFYFYRELDIISSLYDSKSEVNHTMFVATMSEVFFHYKIRHKVFLSQPDYYKSLTDMRHLYESVKGIQVTSTGLCLFHPNYALEPGSIPSYFENQEMVTFTCNKYYKPVKARWWPFWTGLLGGGEFLALGHPVLGAAIGIPLMAITPIVYGIKKGHAKKYCRFDLAKEKLPAETDDKNRTELSYEVKIVPGETNLAEVKKQNLSWGKSKAAEMRDLCKQSTMYFRKINPYQKQLGLIKPVTITDQEEVEEEKQVKEFMKKEIDDIGLSVKDFRSYKYDELNFFDKNSPIKILQEFTLSNVSWNFNDYIIIEAGKFIGEQLRVPDDSKDRTQDFYIPFQKNYSNTISIVIPDGYVIQNPDEFNFSKSTAAGEFSSKGKTDGNKFVITTTKRYLFQFYPKEKANDIFSFLQEANEFWGKKLILKKA